MQTPLSLLCGKQSSTYSEWGFPASGGAFPADCPHLNIFTVHTMYMFSRSRYLYSSFPRERSFQHIVEFNHGSAFTYHRILIVKTAVHPSLDPKLLSALRRTFTSGFNLRALGTRRPLYFLLRVKQRPVFLLNSRLNHFCAPAFACARTGILFPKLRM